MVDSVHNLLGKSHIFPDGDSLTIVQVRERDDNVLYITYLVQRGPGIPQKLVMSEPEFIEQYGHLFNLDSENPSV